MHKDSLSCSFGSNIAVYISVLGPLLQFPWQFWVPYGSCHFSFESHMAVGSHPMHPKDCSQMMRHGPFETVVASWLLPALGSPLYIGHPLGVLALESLEKYQYNKEGGAMSSRREGGKVGWCAWGCIEKRPSCPCLLCAKANLLEFLDCPVLLVQICRNC